MKNKRNSNNNNSNMKHTLETKVIVVIESIFQTVIDGHKKGILG